MDLSLLPFQIPLAPVEFVRTAVILPVTILGQKLDGTRPSFSELPMPRSYHVLAILVLLFFGVAPAADDAGADRALRRGISRYGRSDYDGALSDFNKAIELKPELADAYLQRGKVLHAQGKYTEALADFNKA